MFSFFSGQGKCSIGYSLFFGNKIAPFAKVLDNFLPLHQSEVLALKPESERFPVDEFLEAAYDFVDLLVNYKYANTAVKSARHVLEAAFLFLESNGLGYHHSIIWIWFEEIQSSIGKCWRSWRRILRLFQQYTEYGDIIPDKKFAYATTSIDSLPEWCSSAIKNYQELMSREFRKPDTIQKYQYPCIRLCKFITSQGIKGFNEVSPAHITLFCNTDKHSTFNGRSGYFTIIRKFIEFLEDTEAIESKTLHLGISSGSAPYEKTVDVLTDVQVRKVESYALNHQNPIELRSSAIVAIGLKMGFRASDVIHLKFSDIDWRQHRIKIVQQKTEADICLSMPVEVGNALFSYIKHGRPRTDSSYVFVRHHAPYGKLTNKICANALYSILPERKQIKGGFHVTRRSFATSLLRNGAGSQMVMDALGHRDPTSVMKYLLMDEDRMRLCPLALSDLGLTMEGGLLL